MTTLNHKQLETLSLICRSGASDASRALSKWLDRDIQVSLDHIEQVSLDAATELLGPVDATVCACCMRISGGVNGQLLLGFDEESGLMLCDALLSREATSNEWGELEISAAMETTNIVGCAFLNALAMTFPKATHSPVNSGDATWIPTPPVFVRDFAASIMQFALVDQACEFDRVLVARTLFTIDGMPVSWRLLLIPDAASLEQLARSLR
jgi:chemotaxis protein CheC